MADLKPLRNKMYIDFMAYLSRCAEQSAVRLNMVGDPHSLLGYSVLDLLKETYMKRKDPRFGPVMLSCCLTLRDPE
jgi:hypothetical protein